jgi:hypothetical protein
MQTFQALSINIQKLILTSGVFFIYLLAIHLFAIVYFRLSRAIECTLRSLRS